jgi:hypothetical protein
MTCVFCFRFVKCRGASMGGLQKESYEPRGGVAGANVVSL